MLNTDACKEYMCMNKQELPASTSGQNNCTVNSIMPKIRVIILWILQIYAYAMTLLYNIMYCLVRKF